MSEHDLSSTNPPSSVLVRAPGFGDGEADTCAELLNSSGASPPTILVVSYTGTPGERVDHFRQHVGTTPSARAVLVGEIARNSAGIEGFDAVETVNAPSDLTGLGIQITEQLSQAGPGVTVCFDSVTALLQYVDVETAYEFLHVIAGRLYAQDAIGHFHIDPSAHEERVVAQIASLFDGNVVVDDEGTVERTSAAIREWQV